jgi:2-keto-4-pentenoate hydratase
MAMEPGSRAQRAAELLLAVRRGAPRLSALPAELAPQTLEEAYAIQTQLLRALGSGVGGWKATLFDARNGICAPLAAEALLHSPARAASNPTATGNTLRFGIEPEIAFRLGADLPPRLPGEAYRSAEVCAAVTSVHAVIEVVVTRYVDADAVTQLERVADNFMNEALVIGPPCSQWRELALGAVPLQVQVDGSSVHSAIGGHPLGDPLLPLVWLANHLASLGRGLRRGEFVTTGSCNGCRYLGPGQVAHADFSGLGTVSVSF